MKLKSFEFNYFGVNTFIVWDETTKDAVIIDPGMFKEFENAEIDRFINENGLHIVGLINTHMHIDHIMGDDYIKEKYGVGLSAHKDDLFLSLGREGQANMFHLNNVKTDPLSIDINLKDGDIIHIGGSYLKVIAVPGHSPGSIALYSPEDGFVITGDALFNGSIGRTDLPGGDYATLIKSISSKLMTLPKETVVYPGHGPSTTILKESQFNPFL